MKGGYEAVLADQLLPSLPIEPMRWVVCYNTEMDLSLGSGKSYCEYMYQSIYLL